MDAHEALAYNIDIMRRKAKFVAGKYSNSNPKLHSIYEPPVAIDELVSEGTLAFIRSYDKANDPLKRVTYALKCAEFAMIDYICPYKKLNGKRHYVDAAEQSETQVIAEYRSNAERSSNSVIQQIEVFNVDDVAHIEKQLYGNSVVMEDSSRRLPRNVRRCIRSLVPPYRDILHKVHVDWPRTAHATLTTTDQSRYARAVAELKLRLVEKTSSKKSNVTIILRSKNSKSRLRAEQLINDGLPNKAVLALLREEFSVGGAPSLSTLVGWRKKLGKSKPRRRVVKNLDPIHGEKIRFQAKCKALLFAGSLDASQIANALSAQFDIPITHRMVCDIREAMVEAGIELPLARNRKSHT